MDLLIPMKVRTKVISRKLSNKIKYGFWETQEVNYSMMKRDKERSISRRLLKHRSHQVRVTDDPVAKNRYQHFINTYNNNA